MVFLKQIELPDQFKEEKILGAELRTCFNGVYPFRIFPKKRLQFIDFAPITLLYGGNGSGKTTLLNVIAEKIGAIRHSEYSKSAFFDRYIAPCEIYGDEIPEINQMLSSDDVFDYVLNIRYLNNGIDEHREQLFKGYTTMKRGIQEGNDELLRLHGLDDYDRWKEHYDAISKTQSTFVKERLARNIDMNSNGETAMRYFTDHIDSNAIYLIDEPENSLSVQFQTELAKYIEDSARFYNCQFIISTHSPIFLAMRDAKIYDLDSCPARTKKWTDLTNVRKYFEFFESHREEFLLTNGD